MKKKTAKNFNKAIGALTDNFGVSPNCKDFPIGVSFSKGDALIVRIHWDCVEIGTPAGADVVPLGYSTIKNIHKLQKVLRKEAKKK